MGSSVSHIDDTVRELNATGRDGKWMARCPCHDDKRQSLSIGIKRNGELMLNCFAGCTYSEMADWLRSRGVVFPDNGKRKGGDDGRWVEVATKYGLCRFKWGESDPDPVIDEIYEYDTPDGEIYKFKIRFMPKDFRSVAYGKGGKLISTWKYCQIDWPYNCRLAFQAAEDARVILITEGEKDAKNAVEKLQLAAMSIGNATSSWNPCWNEWVKNAKGFIVIADNDAAAGKKKNAGIEHGHMLCQQLKNNGFPVKLLVFDKVKDLSDWIDAGGTREQLFDLIRGLQPWEPPKYEPPKEIAAAQPINPGPEDKTWTGMQFFPDSDARNAERFAHEYGDVLRWVPEEQCYYHWNGRFWEADHAERSLEYAKTIGKRIIAEIPYADYSIRQNLEKWGKKCQDEPRIKALLRLARPLLITYHDEFDTQEYKRLLNCKNGVLDLETGALLKHDPNRRITQMCPVDYEEGFPEMYTSHLYRCFENDEELIKYYQMDVGYCLSAENYFQSYRLWHGLSGTGKSQTQGVLKLLLGNYFGTLDPPSICEHEGGRRDAGADSDLASTRSKRVVFVSEMKGTQRIDEQIVKAMTGGDVLRVKRMREDRHDLCGYAHLFFTGNERPKISASDSIIRRTIEYPFKAVVPEDLRRENFDAEIVAYDGGKILHWHQQGFARANLKALEAKPQAIQLAVKEYANEMNLIAQWLEECTTEAYGANTMPLAAYESFSKWLKASGFRYSVTKQAFYKLMVRENHRAEPNHIKVCVYKGFTLI